MAEMSERILACALDHYTRQGLDGLSMRKMADRLGVSATAIYRHYRNKEDLLRSIIEEALSMLDGYLLTALSGHTPEERLRKALGRYLDFAMEKTRYYEAIFLTPQQMGGALQSEKSIGKGLDLVRFFSDRVEECMDSGFLAKGDAHSAAMSLCALIHGHTSLYLGGKCAEDEAGFRKMFGDSLNRVLQGLGP
jgi:AcrR family transcriptional regulator